MTQHSAVSLKTLAVLMVALCLIQIASCQTFTASYSQQSDELYISTDSIARADYATISPAISIGYQPSSEYGGPLGINGPLGPFGPLGTLGPLGDNSWNVSEMMSSFQWSSYSTVLSLNGGPISSSGPLGDKGPLNPSIYEGIQEPGLSLFSNNQFAEQLRGFGLWSAIGPIGPLGALGPLGPLGTIGGTGYSTDQNGNFLDSNGNVVRQITMDYSSTARRQYNLFETYQDTYASNNENLLDTSFMILGTFQTEGSTSFSFTSPENQIVTITLLPEKSLDTFALTLTDGSGSTVASSTNAQQIQTITIKMGAGSSFNANVSLTSSYQVLSKTYRLIVVGSTQYVNMNNVSGNHILPYYTMPSTSVSAHLRKRK